METQLEVFARSGGQFVRQKDPRLEGEKPYSLQVPTYYYHTCIVVFACTRNGGGTTDGEFKYARGLSHKRG